MATNSLSIITKPEVHIISLPMFRAHPKYELPPHGNAAENIIATAGKVCYDSYGLDGNPVAKHVEGLVNSGHHSVLEHVHVGLFIAGISRGCSHEIVRHRMFNYSQRSTRYTAEDDAAIVLDPYYADIYSRSPEEESAWERDLLDDFIERVEIAFAGYRWAIKQFQLLSKDARVQQGTPTGKKEFRKWCRGKARQLLPHALETRMVMTGNLRAWRHFLLMRSSRHAEAEIRRLAEKVYFTLQPIAPQVFADLRGQEVDGFLELTEGGKT